LLHRIESEFGQPAGCNSWPANGCLPENCITLIVARLNFTQWSLAIVIMITALPGIDNRIEKILKNQRSGYSFRSPITKINGYAYGTGRRDRAVSRLVL
jgi:hypothetical protein